MALRVSIFETLVMLRFGAMQKRAILVVDLKQCCKMNMPLTKLDPVRTENERSEVALFLYFIILGVLMYEDNIFRSVLASLLEDRRTLPSDSNPSN